MTAPAGAWHPVPVGDGDALAVSGNRIAVATAAGLQVALAGRVVADVQAPWPAPGTPRFLVDRVLWGPGTLTLPAGGYQTLDAAAPRRRPGGDERASVYAWSADGSRLLACFPGRCELISGDGHPLGALPFPGSEAPPTAAWVGAGRARVDLADVGLDLLPIVAMAADDAERHLLAVALNQRAVVVDLVAGTVVDAWPGPWVHGAVSPSGRRAALLAGGGDVILIDLVDGRFGAATAVQPPRGGPGAPRAVALDETTLGVCGGGTVATAALEPRR